MSFDDEESRPQRWNADRYAAFREIFELFNGGCGKHVVPDYFLSLDETLYISDEDTNNCFQAI